MTNPKSKSKVQVQVQTDDWVFIKIRFSNHPAGQPHPGKFQRSNIQQYIQNKSCQYTLGGYETCFGIRLDPKTILWESKRAENHSIQDFFDRVKVSNIYKVEADIH